MLTSTSLPAQTSVRPLPVEEVHPKKDGINIPYKKYKYPNGLTLIIHEDDSDPVVYVDVTYHVGSARETPGRSGFAHFFEHMMFQGSDNVGDEQHFAIVTESGGTLNGTTNRDRTNYFETLPSNQLETALWLEADRMGFLLDAVTTKKFEIQRATVKNERGQNYDNRPYGLAGEKTAEALYPFGHPYSWLTIGYHEDIDRYTLENLKNFFLRWYGPNNATLTVAGKVEEQQVLDLVGKYFGSIPAGPEVKNLPPMTVTLPEDRYISYEDNIRFPLLSMTYPSPQMNTREELALDIAAYLLGGSENKKSPLYQRLVKTQKAMQASASNPTSELAGQFTFSVIAYPGIMLSEMEKEVRQIIEAFANTPIDTAAMNEYITSQVSDLVFSLQSVQRKGSMLAAYETFTGNPDYIEKVFEDFASITPEEVMAAFRKYIYQQHAVVLSVYPKGQKDIIAAPDNFKRPPFPENFQPDLSEYNGLTYVKGQDNFDRSKRPEAGENPVVEVPKFWKNEWANGIKVIGTTYDELPITNISLFFKAGQLAEPLDKAGLATLTAQLLREGTATLSAEEFASELKKIGSRIQVNATETDLVVSISSLNQHLDRTVELANAMLFTPRFDEQEFKRLKDQQLQLIQNARTNASLIAAAVEAKISYPKDHIFSTPAYGKDSSINHIQLEDIKKFYETYFAPDHAEIVVVGALDEAALINKFSYLKRMPKKGVRLPVFTSVQVPEKTTIIFAHKDRSPQSQIKVTGKGLRYDGTGDYYKANIANYPLGGMFNSRININLRERKGFTYGARSFFEGTDYLDKFGVSTSVRADATDSAVVEILSELNQYVRDGITEQELDFTRRSIGQRDALKYETANQKAMFMRTLIDNDFNANLVKEQLDILARISKNEIDNIARKYIQPDHLNIIVVGDKALVLDKLKALGYPVIEVDINGNPVH